LGETDEGFGRAVVSVFLGFLFLTFSLSPFTSCLPLPACSTIIFDLMPQRSARSATPHSRSLACFCLVLELTCQNRLHVRHGNLDRRRDLPNNIHPCRRSTPGRLGRFRMGRSIRLVLLYVSVFLLLLLSSSLWFSTIVIHHHNGGWTNERTL